MIYSSRSRVETFQDCYRKGYINFLWGGRGIVKRAASVYLSTGSYVHVGLEYLFKFVKNTPTTDILWEEVIDSAVHLSYTLYWKEITARGFDLEDGENKDNNNYVIAEQCALVEAFIRAFAVRVLPDLLSRFKVVDVEREEIVTVDNLIIQARIDVILKEIETNDIYIVSFKTAAQWDRRQEKSNEHDNQGLSETWVLEHRLQKENLKLLTLTAGLDEESTLNGLNPKVRLATEKYNEYIRKFLKNEKVMGVIMIYMLKGKRYESSSTPGLYQQHSPLIRAYRKLQGTDYEYAPHLYFDNPTNKSGKGRLGKGWESFNVWECEEVGYVKGWIQMLVDNKVSGGDVIGETFKVPAPYFRNQDHLDDWFEQHQAIESDILKNELDLKSKVDEGVSLRKALNSYFQQTRKHCHYPVTCPYENVCYNSEIFKDPIGSGEYIYRKPHHLAELEEHEKLYQITNSKIEEVGQKNGLEIKSQEEQVLVSEEVSLLDEEIIIE